MGGHRHGRLRWRRLLRLLLLLVLVLLLLPRVRLEGVLDAPHAGQGEGRVGIAGSRRPVDAAGGAGRDVAVLARVHDLRRVRRWPRVAQGLARRPLGVVWVGHGRRGRCRRGRRGDAPLVTTPLCKWVGLESRPLGRGGGAVAVLKGDDGGGGGGGGKRSGSGSGSSTGSSSSSSSSSNSTQRLAGTGLA